MATKAFEEWAQQKKLLVESLARHLILGAQMYTRQCNEDATEPEDWSDPEDLQYIRDVANTMFEDDCCDSIAVQLSEAMDRLCSSDPRDESEKQFDAADAASQKEEGLLQCPGCGCEPGDGITESCNHPGGCGFHKEYRDGAD